MTEAKRSPTLMPPGDVQLGEPVLRMAAGSFLDLDAREFIEVCAQTEHLGGLGLRVSGEHSLDRSRWAEWGTLFESHGLKIFDVEVHRIGSEPGPYVDSVEELIRLAAAIGAENILVVGDNPDRNVVERELRRIIPIAADHGLGVGLEYMAWTMPHSLSDARYLAEVTGCRLVVDVLHHARLGATSVDLAEIVAAGLLGWVQVCDASRDVPPNADALIHEARHGRCVPGRGALPLADFLSVVPNSTTISIEVQSDELLGVDAAERARLLTTSTREVVLQAFNR